MSAENVLRTIPREESCAGPREKIKSFLKMLKTKLRIERGASKVIEERGEKYLAESIEEQNTRATSTTFLREGYGTAKQSKARIAETCALELNSIFPLWQEEVVFGSRGKSGGGKSQKNPGRTA